jgi:alpha/beta superfamily hydrolase
MASYHSSIRSFFLSGAAGKLEAVLNVGAEDARYAALVCHPHPVYGGTLHNKVVFHSMKALHGFGFPVLRFNFRGAGLSEGTHDNGRGEVDDVRVALDWLHREFHLPLILAGFSFGAAVGLAAACLDQRVRALTALGLPLAPLDGRSYDFSFLRDCPRPKLFISGTEDQFTSQVELERFVESIPGANKLVLVEGADHFFEGRLHQVREIIQSWIKDQLDL